MFTAGSAEQRLLALFAVQHRKHFSGPRCLVPVNVSRMVRRLVVAQGRVAVKNRSSKGRSFNRIAIAPARDVPTGQNEFKFADTRLAEQGNGASPKTFFTGIMFHLL